MELFISKGLWKYRNYQVKLEKVYNNQTKLTIPNFERDENDKEKVRKINFVLPVEVSDLEEIPGNCNIPFSSLRKTSNRYAFVKQEKSTNSKIVYALLHYAQVVPSEIYIPVSMKNHIEVLEEIKFYDVEPDYGKYLVKLYFVKITIFPDETIPFYLSWRSGLKILENHLVFANEKHSGIKVTECRTYIRLNSLKRTEYIPLSEL